MHSSTGRGIERGRGRGQGHGRRELLGLKVGGKFKALLVSMAKNRNDSSFEVDASTITRYNDLPGH